MNICNLLVLWIQPNFSSFNDTLTFLIFTNWKSLKAFSVEITLKFKNNGLVSTVARILIRLNTEF